MIYRLIKPEAEYVEDKAQNAGDGAVVDEDLRDLYLHLPVGAAEDENTVCPHDDIEHRHIEPAPENADVAVDRLQKRESEEAAV